MVTIRSRSDWGAGPNKRADRGALVIGNLSGITVHWPGGGTSLTKLSIDQVRKQLRAWQAMHRRNGWADIGYNYLIDGAGRIWEGCGLYRGAHAGTMTGNMSTMGVQLITGTNEAPTQAQIDSFRELRAWLLSKNKKAKVVRPHSSWVGTECPGSRIRSLISSGTLSKAPAKTPTKPKPGSGVNKKAKAWWNASFANTWNNSVEGGRNYKSRLSNITQNSVTVGPAIVAFSEVRDSQKGEYSRSMKAKGYRRLKYVKSNMLDVYGRADVNKPVVSFAKFSRQRKNSNVEGALRIRFRVGGSKAQVVVLHLDAYSSEADREHNLLEAYAAAERFGKSLTPDWKSKTLFYGDFNSKKVAAKILGARGFKQMDTGPGGDNSIDQAWVGEKRDDRGGRTDTIKSDHKRKLVRLGRK